MSCRHMKVNGSDAKLTFSFFLMLSDQFTLIEGLSLLEAEVLFDHALGTPLTAGTTAAY